MLKITRDEYIVNRLFKELPKIDNKIPSINQGGCGIFAKALSDRLLTLNIEHTIVGFSTYSDEAIENWKGYLKGDPIDLKECVPSHILIKTDIGYIDSEGQVDDKIKSRRKIHLVEYTREQLDILISNGGWNRCFERDKYSPVIEMMMDTILMRLQTELTKHYQTK